MNDPLINVVSFKAGDKSAFKFEFKDTKNVYSLGCDERAKKSFYDAVKNIETDAAGYFNIAGYKLTLVKIKWDGKISVSFCGQNSDAGIYGLSLSKNGIKAVYDLDKDLGIMSNSHNQFIDALDAFRDECAAYIRGDREQQSFNFSNPGTGKETDKTDLLESGKTKRIAYRRSHNK